MSTLFAVVTESSFAATRPPRVAPMLRPSWLPRTAFRPGGHPVGERIRARHQLPRHRRDGRRGSGRRQRPGLTAMSGPTLLVLVVIVTALLLVARVKAPAVYWTLVGLPAALYRVLSSYRPTMEACKLTVAPPWWRVFARKLSAGEQVARPGIPRIRGIRPTSTGLRRPGRMPGIPVHRQSAAVTFLTAVAVRPRCRHHLGSCWRAGRRLRSSIARRS